MDNNSGTSRNLVLTYLQHRSAIGWLGVSLPVVVYLIARIFYHTGLQSSISVYYYTGSRNFFVGIMAAISAFMFAYNGPEPADRRAAWVASLSAALVAVCPAKHPLTGALHLTAAFLFFAAMIYFCLVQFVRSAPGTPPTPEKLKRNRVYRSCGYTMAVCILLIGVLALNKGLDASLAWLKPVFWLEAIAIWAFGIAWLTKGETLFPDK